MLRGGIRRHADAALEGQHRGDIDDAAGASGRDHVSGCGLRQQKGRLQVDVEHTVPVFLGIVEQVGAANDAGIVDEDVDAAEGGHDVADRRRRVERPGEIDGQFVKANTRLSYQRCRLRHGRRTEGGDIGAGPRECQGHALAEAGAGAGDEGGLACEVKQRVQGEAPFR
ncbi:hypothetical protein D9M70_466690 [compost metagenome]